MLSVELTLVNAMAVLIAVLFLLRWARGYPQALLLMFFAYTVVSVNASVFFLDHWEVFISETGTVSHGSNAWLRLLLFNALIVGGVGIGFGVWSTLFGRLGTRVTPSTPSQCRRVLWLMVAIIGIASANVLVSPEVPYPGSGFGRSSFWEDRLRFPIIADVFGILLFFVPFVCAAVELYGRELARRRLVTFARVVLALYFVYLVIGGQVLHGLLLPATVVIAMLIGEKVQSRKSLLPPRRMLMAIAGGAALTVTVYLSFKSRGITQSFDNVWGAIVYRVLALQGSTYWQADSMWASYGATGSPEALLDGRKFLILSIMPKTLGDSYLGAGINLSGALPGTSLLSVGLWPTLLICVGYGVLLGLVTSLVYALAVNGRVILLLPSAYLWLWTMGAYSRSSLEEIVSIKYLIFAVIVAAGTALSQSSVGRSRGKAEWTRSPPSRQGKTSSQDLRSPSCRGSHDNRVGR